MRQAVFPLVAGWVVVLCYVLPYFIYGKSLPLVVHDNLDSNLVWIKVLLEGGHFTDFDATTVSPIMNGLPVSSLAPVYNFSALLIATFGLFWGYVACKSLMAMMAYVGAWLLVRRFIMPFGNTWVITAAAVCYGVLPFWGFGFSMASLPFLFVAFMSIRRQGLQAPAWAWVIFALGGFISSLISIGFFFIALCGLWAVYDAVFGRHKLLPSLLGLILLSISYSLTHIRLFIGFFGESHVSHRIEIESTYTYIGLIFSRFNDVFIEGWYHSASCHTYILIPILACFFLAFRQMRQPILYLNILEFLVLSSLWFSIINWSGLAFIMDPLQAILPLQFGRLQFLQALAWIIAFTLALHVLVRVNRFGTYAAMLIIAGQVVYLFTLFENSSENENISFEHYYAEALFAEAREQLGDPSTYRVLSVGIPPAVALYNGFYTLDGYVPDYPLAYKEEFGRLIQGELERDAALAKGFEAWGSRAYAFSAELGGDYTVLKGQDMRIERLELDRSLFREMGGKYLFSAVAISDPDFDLVAVFKDDGSAWDVFVYGLE